MENTMDMDLDMDLEVVETPPANAAVSDDAQSATDAVPDAGTTDKSTDKPAAAADKSTTAAAATDSAEAELLIRQLLQRKGFSEAEIERHRSTLVGTLDALVSRLGSGSSGSSGGETAESAADEPDTVAAADKQSFSSSSDDETPVFTISARTVVAKAATSQPLASDKTKDADSAAKSTGSMGRVMNVNALVKSYSQLNDWIDRSLDRFRPELTTVAYPLFVHTFLDIMASSDALGGLSSKYAQSQTQTDAETAADLCFEKAKLLLQQFGSIHEELHSADIRTLRAITAPQQAKSSGLCRLYRNNRYTVRVSIAARRLLEAFLQDTSSDEMLRLLNQYIDFAPEDDRNVAASGGVSGGPIDRTAVSAASRKYDVGITGQSGAHVIEINSAAIALGAPPKPTGLDEQLTKVAKYMPQTVRDTSETDLDPSGLLAASGIGLSKRDRSQTAAADGDGGSLPVDPLPQAPLRSTDVLTEFQRLRDLRKRVNLSSTALPSVCAFTVLNTSGAMTCASATDDLSLMACGFSESYIKLWNLKGEPLRGVQGSTGLVPININSSSDMANHRDNYSSATRRLIGHSSSVYAVKFSSDRRFLLSCSADQTARLWSLDTFTNLVCYKGHLGPVWDLDVSPVGPYFVTGSHDRTARLWSTEHTYPLRVFVGHSSDVDCVKFHPNTNYVITGSSDRTIRLWSTHNGQCVRIFTGHDDAISCLAISPDGRMLASAAEDKAIILWDLASGRQIQRMTGHIRSINSLAFDVDGRLLMSGGADNTVRLWSTTSTSTSNGSINGLKRSQDGKSVTESQNLLTTLHTKMTPVYSTQFTPRNLGYMIGAYLG